MRLRPIGLAGLVGLVAGPVLAGPPFISDDPATAAPRTVEAIAAFLPEDRKSGRWYQTPLLDVVAGVVEDVEVGFLLPWSVVDANGRSERTGIGNLTLNAKWRFWKSADASLQAALAPNVQFDTSDGGVDRGPAQDSFTVIAPLLLQASAGRFDVYMDTNYQWRPTGPDGWFVGLVGGMQVIDRLGVFGELTVDTSKDFRDTDVAVSGGFDLAISDRLHLLAAAGPGVRNGGGDRLDWRGYVGLQWIMGPFGRTSNR